MSNYLQENRCIQFYCNASTLKCPPGEETQMKDVVFTLFFLLSWNVTQAVAMTSAAISCRRLILILSCFGDGGALQSPRCARHRRPTCPAAQCWQNGGHSGCFSLVTLVIPWQHVLFGGLTEKYDMVLWLCGECSNKDGEPCWTLRWNARSISLVRVMNALVSNVFTHPDSYLTCLSQRPCPPCPTSKSYLPLPFYTQLFIMH